MIQIYDFEATGLDKPAATQIGTCRLDKDYQIINSSCKSDYINPLKPISWGAMGLTGITNEMVEGKPTFEEVIPKYKVHSDTKYVVCHNMSFDSRFFPEDFTPKGVKLLCTYRLAKMLIQKSLCENHKNATLYYYLGCYKNPFGKEHIEKAHDALSDVLMTANVLVEMLIQNELTIDEAYTLLYDPTVCKGGKKYERGTPWKDIILEDYDYVEYTFKNTELSEEELSYLETLLEEYSYLKEEQLDLIGFGKLKGGSWKESVISDRGYVQWAAKTLQWRNPDELAYVKKLLSGES